jgi:uncharacterized protein
MALVGALQVELHLPLAESLKDKRSVLKSLKDQLHNRFNVSVIELDSNVKWQRASLGVAAIGVNRQSVHDCLGGVVEWLRLSRFVEVISVEEEIC